MPPHEPSADPVRGPARRRHAARRGAPARGEALNGAARSGPPIRIAMWSGPRTVSTALMRSWESRPDTVVVDEPLYAFYLARTGIEHPGRRAILISQPNDWRAVLTQLTDAALPAGRSICCRRWTGGPWRRCGTRT